MSRLSTHCSMVNICVGSFSKTSFAPVFKTTTISSDFFKASQRLFDLGWGEVGEAAEAGGVAPATRIGTAVVHAGILTEVVAVEAVSKASLGPGWDLCSGTPNGTEGGKWSRYDEKDRKRSAEHVAIANKKGGGKERANIFGTNKQINNQETWSGQGRAG